MAASSSSLASACYEPLTSSSVPKHDIFLSHSGVQKPFVTALYHRLRTCYSTFFDITRHSLPLGEDFPSHIFHAARTCRMAVVVVSQEYLQSKWPMVELCAFVEAKPRPKIVPLFFKLAPYDLKQKQNQDVWRRAWAEFAKEDSRNDVSKWDSAFKELGRHNGIPLNPSEEENAYIDRVFSHICENLLPSMRHDFSGIPGIDRMSQVCLPKFAQFSGISALTDSPVDFPRGMKLSHVVIDSGRQEEKLGNQGGVLEKNCEILEKSGETSEATGKLGKIMRIGGRSDRVFVLR